MPMVPDDDFLYYAHDADVAIRAIEESLLTLEGDPKSHDAIHTLHRSMHTLKGNSGALGLEHIEHTAHVCEDLMAVVGKSGNGVDEAVVELVLRTLDALRVAVAFVGRERRDVEGDSLAPVVAQLEAALAERGGERGPELMTGFIDFDELPTEAPAAAPGPSLLPRAVDETRTELLRIDATKVSQLLDLAGELGLACAAVTRHPSVEGQDLDGFSSAAHRLELLVAEIQNDLSALRLVPVASSFSRLRRVVRDAARRTGKQVDLEILGGETEVDKVMLDALQDPLVHVLRNAVDHGIEDAEGREAARKTKAGRITLSAIHRGGEVTLEVADDGRGLDAEGILTRARERGLWTSPEPPTEDELAELVFEPGFSTKAVADELSGRGIGMDVLRSTVESMRGRVRLRSVAGKGTRIAISLPLTLAYVDAMVVRDNERLFALPIEKVFEVSRLTPGRIVRGTASGQTLVRVRDACVPVCWLHDFWSEPGPTPKLSDDGIVVVVQTTHGPLALPVDELVGNQQVMLKPLKGPLSRIRGAAGCGVLRTGDIAVALDCEQLHA